MEELIRFKQLSKRQTDKQQFLDLSFSLYAGEVSGLISDNLRVQEALCEILKGELLPDKGAIYIGGRRMTKSDAATFFKRRVFFVDCAERYSQELTVADLFFISPWKGGMIHRRKILERELEEIYRTYRIPVPSWKEKAVCLPKLARCRAAMVRAAICGTRIFVLRGISGFLNQNDVHQLMDTVLEFVKRGAAVLMLDYDRSLLMNYSQKLIALRNGMTEYIFRQQDAAYADMLRSSFLWEENNPPARSDAVLEFQGFRNEEGRVRSFSVGAGEIVGLLDNTSYKNEMVLSLLQGKMHAEASFLLNGKRYTPLNLYDAIHRGIAFVVESFTPQDNMLIETMSISDNLLLTMSEKKSGMPVWRYRKILEKECDEFFGKEIAGQIVKDLDLPDRQKLIYFRWLLYYPSVLVCYHPFSGSNPHMKRVTEEMIRTCAEKGIAVLILSTGISEAYSICDRVVQL